MAPRPGTQHRYVAPWLSRIPAEQSLGKGDGARLSLSTLQTLVQAEPEGKWTDEELEQLKEDYLEHRARKDSGTRATNAEAAKDVTKTGDFIFDEVSAVIPWKLWKLTHLQLVRVGQRTGARGFCVLAGSNSNDTIAPTVVGTTESVKFLHDIYNITPDAFASKFFHFSALNASNVKEEASHKRGTFVKVLSDGLSESRPPFPPLPRSID